MKRRPARVEDPRFTALRRAFASDPAATPSDRGGVPPATTGRAGFGDDALKVDGRIFAMMTRGRLVVKLPGPRVDAVVAAGAGERFATGARVMKEWVVIVSPSLAWLDVAREAHAFVRRVRG